MFKRSKTLPEKISEAGVSKWYSSIDDRDKVILQRYIDNADGSSDIAFFTTVIDIAAKDENFAFASSVGDFAKGLKMKGMQLFLFNEALIPSYISVERYNDAVSLCEENLRIYPEISNELVKKNGGVPKRLNCRNRLIDIMVGVNADYDGAAVMMDRFFDLGLIDGEELELRKNSLKIHRMQRVFDGVYTYRPKE